MEVTLNNQRVGTKEPRGVRPAPIGFVDRRRAVPACAALLMTVWLTIPSAHAAEEYRLRFTWGGGSSQLWNARLKISSGGQLSEGRSLGLEADAPAAVYSTGNPWERVWHVSPRVPRTFDALEILATANDDAVLTLELSSDRDPRTPTVLEIPLRQIVDDGYSTELDGVGNRITVKRAPGDSLRVRSERAGVIFRPGETWTIHPSPHGLNVSSRSSLRCEASMKRARESGELLWRAEQVWRYDRDGRTEGLEPLQVPIPNEEGVYELHLNVYRRGLSATFALAKPLASRKVQFVVLASDPSSTNGGAESVVADFNPANPSWFDRFATLPQWKLLPRMRQGRLGNTQLQTWEHADRQWSRLSPQGWVAYPLPINQVGQPHAVEIEFPADIAQDASISVIEPDASGGLANLNLDSGIIVSDPDLPFDVSDSAGTVVHRLVFWPRSKSPLVLITNQQMQGAVVFGTIRVLCYDRTLPAERHRIPTIAPNATVTPLAVDDNSEAVVSSWRPEQLGNLSEVATTSTDSSEHRMRLAFLDQPSFVRNFMTTEAVDDDSKQPYEDWQTFYEGALRLAEYLKYAGYDGASLSVAADGGALYPSRLFHPTPQYDRGVFFSSGQDLQQKDVLELLFRVFDREGLRLIPVVSFSGLLPGLEAELRDAVDPLSAGILMTAPPGARVSSAATSSTVRGTGPHYNPTHPVVQREMHRAVIELVERYGKHQAFGGVNVNLQGNGYSQFPDLGWGIDLATVERFLAATGPANGREAAPLITERLQRAAALTVGDIEPNEQALLNVWAKWRADQLSNFYVAIAADLQSAGVGRIYLSTCDLLLAAPMQRWAQHALQRRQDPVDAYLELGLNVSVLSQASGLTLLHAYPQGRLTELRQQMTNLEILQASDTSRSPPSTGEPSGTQVYRTTSHLQPPANGEQVLFGRERLDQLQLNSHFVATGSLARKPFAHCLAQSDDALYLDGGNRLGMGQEAYLRDFFSTFRALPGVRFSTLNLEKNSPVVVRSYTDDRQSYVYLVNDSPWAARVALKCEMSANTIVTPLGDVELLPPESRGNQAIWNVTIEPFGLVAARFSRPDVRFVAAVTSLPHGVARQLGDLLDDVASRAEEATKTASALPLPRDSGFEAPLFDEADETSPWKAIQDKDASAQPDHVVTFAGNQSVRLLSEGGKVKVHSESFAPPETGRLYLSLRVQTSQVDPMPRLLLRLESTDRDFQPYCVLPPITPNQWHELSLDVHEFPHAEGLRLRVAVECDGPGEVWIDELRLYDRRFGHEEYLALLKLLQVINTQLNSGDVAGCYAKLGGYWPRFLLRFVPPPANVVATRPPRPTRSPTPAKKPSMLERWQQYVPRALQF